MLSNATKSISEILLMHIFTAFFKIQDNRVKYNVHDCWRIVLKILYSILLYNDSLNLEAWIAYQCQCRAVYEGINIFY